MDRSQKVDALLSRNVYEVIDKDHLRAALLSEKRLRVKLGIDPTGEKIHIGYAITLWKLKEFQDLGHTIVLIIGDFTAQVGDASDKLQRRPLLTKEEVERNLKNYLPQIGEVIDLRRTEVRYNSEWLAKLNFQEISTLADIFTVRQMIERRNFRERWDKNEEISLRELLYPLMQGYDSVAVKADVELGGTDQLFNLLAGRKIQEHYGQKPQDILTTKLLVGLDGRKMSKSWGNVINVIDSPDEQFGKVMSLHDDLIVEYFRLATDLPEEKIKSEKRTKYPNLKIVKERLAFEIVKRYHGEAKARAAREKFEKLFSRREMPENLPELKLPRKEILVLELVVASGVAKSKSEARRLVEQRGFEFDGRVIKDPLEKLRPAGGEVARIGKKAFFRLKI